MKSADEHDESADELAALESRREELALELKKWQEKISIRRSARDQQRTFFDVKSRCQIQSLLRENEEAGSRNDEFKRICDDVAHSTRSGGLGKDWQRFLQTASQTYPDFLSKDAYRSLASQCRQFEAQNGYESSRGPAVRVQEKTDIRQTDLRTWNSRFVWAAQDGGDGGGGGGGQRGTGVGGTTTYYNNSKVEGEATKEIASVEDLVREIQTGVITYGRNTTDRFLTRKASEYGHHGGSVFTKNASTRRAQDERLPMATSEGQQPENNFGSMVQQQARPSNVHQHQQDHGLHTSTTRSNGAQAPAFGSAGYESYSKLRGYEMEMQSDLQVLNRMAVHAGIRNQFLDEKKRNAEKETYRPSPEKAADKDTSSINNRSAENFLSHVASALSGAASKELLKSISEFSRHWQDDLTLSQSTSGHQGSRDLSTSKNSRLLSYDDAARNKRYSQLERETKKVEEEEKLDLLYHNQEQARETAQVERGRSSQNGTDSTRRKRSMNANFRKRQQKYTGDTPTSSCADETPRLPERQTVEEEVVSPTTAALNDLMVDHFPPGPSIDRELAKSGLIMANKEDSFAGFGGSLVAQQEGGASSSSAGSSKMTHSSPQGIVAVPFGGTRIVERSNILVASNFQETRHECDQETSNTNRAQTGTHHADTAEPAGTHITRESTRGGAVKGVADLSSDPSANTSGSTIRSVSQLNFDKINQSRHNDHINSAAALAVEPDRNKPAPRISQAEERLDDFFAQKGRADEVKADSAHQMTPDNKGGSQVEEFHPATATSSSQNNTSASSQAIEEQLLRGLAVNGSSIELVLADQQTGVSSTTFAGVVKEQAEVEPPTSTKQGLISSSSYLSPRLASPRHIHGPDKGSSKPGSSAISSAAASPRPKVLDAHGMEGLGLSSDDEEEEALFPAVRVGSPREGSKPVGQAEAREDAVASVSKPPSSPPRIEDHAVSVEERGAQPSSKGATQELVEEAQAEAEQNKQMNSIKKELENKNNEAEILTTNNKKYRTISDLSSEGDVASPQVRRAALHTDEDAVRFDDEEERCAKAGEDFDAGAFLAPQSDRQVWSGSPDSSYDDNDFEEEWPKVEDEDEAEAEMEEQGRTHGASQNERDDAIGAQKNPLSSLIAEARGALSSSSTPVEDANFGGSPMRHGEAEAGGTKVEEPKEHSSSRTTMVAVAGGGRQAVPVVSLDLEAPAGSPGSSSDGKMKTKKEFDDILDLLGDGADLSEDDSIPSPAMTKMTAPGSTVAPSTSAFITPSDAGEQSVLSSQFLPTARRDNINTFGFRVGGAGPSSSRSNTSSASSTLVAAAGGNFAEGGGTSSSRGARQSKMRPPFGGTSSEDNTPRVNLIAPPATSTFSVVDGGRGISSLKSSSPREKTSESEANSSPLAVGGEAETSQQGAGKQPPKKAAPPLRIGASAATFGAGASSNLVSSTTGSLGATTTSPTSHRSQMGNKNRTGAGLGEQQLLPGAGLFGGGRAGGSFNARGPGFRTGATGGALGTLTGQSSTSSLSSASALGGIANRYGGGASKAGGKNPNTASKFGDLAASSGFPEDD
ncbi:unnamed protein product [Amoebophrya sp. A25]|nr:unnamed protein product [Amoebophrya sp. A25]|eukprot:GSA25T00022170001.1